MISNDTVFTIIVAMVTNIITPNGEKMVLREKGLQKYQIRYMSKNGTNGYYYVTSIGKIFMPFSTEKW